MAYRLALSTSQETAPTNLHRQTCKGKRRSALLVCTLLIVGVASCGGRSGSRATQKISSQTSVGSGTTANTGLSSTATGPSDSSLTETSSSETSSSETSSNDGPSVVINVPAEAPTIQAGIDKAKPGDLVLIAPGTYNEAVFVRTERVNIRGVDRNSVILDGQDALENGITVSANGVAIENLSVHNYLVNGIVFTKKYDDDADSLSTAEIVLKGYRASYITAYNNGLYGMYAFYASNGQMDHSYVSGNPDGGIYIGQCNPCNALITDVIGERNAIGFLGTNASGNLSVVNSQWRNNNVGILPQSEDSEFLAPQRNVLVAGNVVEDNNGGEAPGYKSWGYGIVIGGGQNNNVFRNLVKGHQAAGIYITDLAQYLPLNNKVSENTASANGVDLAFTSSNGSKQLWAGGKNCFAKNLFATSSPAAIETELPCDGIERSVEILPIALQSKPVDVDYRKVKKPQNQPIMPNAASAPAVAAVGLPAPVDLNNIKVPQ